MSTSLGDDGGDHWLPVESNPEVFNDYAAKLGWPTSQFCWQDLLSFEDWATAMIPRPVLAVAMLYNIVPAQEAHREAEELVRAAAPPAGSSPFFITQEIANACGTIALVHGCVHASAAAGGPVALPPGTWFARFAEKALPLGPAERAVLLREDEGLAASHADAVQGGQSAVVDDTWQHFVCFVSAGGRLWELDGRKGGPIDHGACGGEALLEGSSRVVQAFMARDPGSLRFTMLALAPPPPPEDD